MYQFVYLYSKQDCTWRHHAHQSLVITILTCNNIILIAGQGEGEQATKDNIKHNFGNIIILDN